MNSELLKAFFEKVPFSALSVLYGLFMGYEYYQFENAPESELNQKKAQLAAIQTENQNLQKKVQEVREFQKKIETKKEEVRAHSQTLAELKGGLSNDLDVPAFMKTTVTEAKKVGMTVLGMKPLPTVKLDYYEEIPFEMNFRGVYVQFLMLLERLSTTQNIVRIDQFELKPIGNQSSRYVELEGKMRIKAHKYLGSKADEIKVSESQKPVEVKKGT